MAEQDKNDKSSSGFARWNTFAGSLRSTAQELSQKAAAQVSEINAKVTQNAGSLTPTATSGSGSPPAASTAAVTASSATTPNQPASLAHLKSDSVSKDDLLEIIQKLNKKVKLLNTARLQLTEKMEMTESMQQRLVHLVQDEILNGAADLSSSSNNNDASDPVPQLLAAWRQKDEQNALNLQTLQSEFARLHREQQQQQQQQQPSTSSSATNGDSNHAWETERKALEERHAHELVNVKETLEKQFARELEQRPSAAADMVASAASSAAATAAPPVVDEIQRVKEAAAQQLQIFKKKVAKARQEELEKLKSELGSAAEQNLQIKLAEQAKVYQVELAELETKLASAKTDGSNNLQEVQQGTTAATQLLNDLKIEHATELERVQEEASIRLAAEIEKTRQQTEQIATTEMEERLQELLGEMRQKHQAELEQVQQSAAEQLAKGSLSTQAVEQSARDSADKTTVLETELAKLRELYEAEKHTLQMELQTTVAERDEREMQLAEDKESAIQMLTTQMEAQIQQLRQSLDESNAETNNVREERLEGELQARVNEAVQVVKATLTSEGEQASAKAESEHQSQLKKFIIDAEQEKSAVLKQARTEAATLREQAMKAAEAEVFRKLQERQAELDTLQKQLTDKAAALQVAKDGEVSLRRETDALRNQLATALREKESAVVAAEEGASGDSELAEALTKEKGAHRSTLDALAASKQTLADLEVRIELVESEKENALSSVANLQQEVDKRRASLENQISSISAAEKGGLERSEELSAKIAQLTDQLTEASASVAAKQDELAAVERVGSGQRMALEAKLSALKKELEMTELGRKEELAEVLKSNESALSALTNNLQAHAKELDDARKAERASKYAYGKLEAELQGGRQELEELRKSTSSQLQGDLGALTEEKEQYGRNLVAARHEIESLQASHVKELADLKVALDEKAASLAEKDATMAAAFNKVKSAYAQKLRNVEQQHTSQMDVLRVEKSELETSVGKLSSELEAVSAEHDERDTSLRESLAEAERKYQREVEDLRRAELTFNETIAKLQNDYENKLGELQRQLDDTANEAKNTDSDKIRTKEQELRHAADLKKLQEEHSVMLESIRKESETVSGLSIEKACAENLQHLDAQAKKFENEKEDLRAKMAEYVDQMKGKFKEKLMEAQEQTKTEKAHLEKLATESNAKVDALLEKLKALSVTATSLKAEKDSLFAQTKADSILLQKLRAELETTMGELEEATLSSSATATSLLEQQESLELEKKNLETALMRAKADCESKANKLEENTGKLAALSGNLEVMIEERRDIDERLKVFERQAKRLKSSEAEVTDLREHINSLKLELTKSASTVNRLQAEKESNERDDGQRTHVVGMLESQLSELNEKNSALNAELEASLYDLSLKDEELQKNEELISNLYKELQEATAACKRANDAAAASQKGADSKNSKAAESLQRELQTIRQQMARKSAAAQKLLQERELECSELRRTNQVLQLEVDKGSLSDRRIFELAAKQSNRESQQMSEIEIRDKIIERMKVALLDRDGELASFEKHVQDVEIQIEELCRVRRREDVNLDYLKSIVVQFLSLPPASTERARLLPVLATLLQFNDADYRTIEDGKNKVSWWGSVAPTLIAAPSAGPSQPVAIAPSSAEISISTTPSTSARENGKRTSLQF